MLSTNRRLLALSLATLLGACASPPPVATVQVFTPAPRLAAGTTYRHERLPSQALLPQQHELEAAADAVMVRAGLRRDDTAPRLSLQLSARQDPAPGGWGWGGPALGIGVSGGGGGGGVGVGLSFPIGGGALRTSYRVDVQMRELGSGQVVFQSQASTGAGVSPASLVQAALGGFPHAGPGTWQVPLAPPAPR